jgi:hypothetical protein
MRCLSRAYRAYLLLLAGARTITLRPGATDRLIADIKRGAHTDLTQTAAADRTRDGHDPITREDNESP